MRCSLDLEAKFRCGYRIGVVIVNEDQIAGNECGALTTTIKGANTSR
jgi:hypothetical protein